MGNRKVALLTGISGISGTTKRCKMCDNMFVVPPTKNKRKLSKNFCNNSCAAKFNGLNNKGKTRSEEFKKELSIKMTGAGNPFWGKSHSEVTKNIIGSKNSWSPKEYSYFEFKTDEEDIFNGILISDGSLEKPSRISSRFTLGFEHRNTQLRIVRDIPSIEFGKIYSWSRPSKVDKSKILTSYHMKSKKYYSLIEQYNLWYPYGTKIIPKTIRFTPLCCYWWYVCDGFKLTDQNNIVLCTDSFDKESMDYACKEFANYEIYPTITTRNRLYLNVKSTKNFLNHIKDIERQKEYEYKFNFQK